MIDKSMQIENPSKKLKPKQRKINNKINTCKTKWIPFKHGIMDRAEEKIKKKKKEKKNFTTSI